MMSDVRQWGFRCVGIPGTRPQSPCLSSQQDALWRREASGLCEPHGNQLGSLSLPVCLRRVPATDEHPSGNEYTERESSRPQLR